MQHVQRIVLLSFFAVTMDGAALAKDEGTDVDMSKASEYKRSDTNFYLKSDIQKATIGAVIIPQSGYTKKDDSYYFTPKIKPPKTLQFEVVNDWIESITPPDAPPGLSIAPSAMVIREPQGDVRVALPTAPGTFTPVTDGMTLVNGAVIKTGANATAAVLFGGVSSARLMPNTSAAVQQTVAATSRLVEIDLTNGGVFSKVGQQVGVKGAYEVHTPQGNAVARGTDFVTIVTGVRTDVWVEQGTVSLDPVDSKAGQMATSDGTGPLKLMRLPAMTDPKQTLLADAETLTAIFDFIPMANQKVAALRARAARGDTLTPGQTDYLNRIKQVPTLIKAALVEKIPPPVVAAPTPREPAAEGGTPPPPLTITLGPGDKVNFEGKDTTVTKLRERLAQIAKANPLQPLEIARDTTVGPILLKRVVDAGQHAKLATKVLDATPGMEAAAPVTPPPAVPAPTPRESAAEGSKTPPAPMTITLGPRDKVNFEGKDTTVTKLKARLAEIASADPTQPLEIARDTSVGPILLKRVVDAGKHVKLATKVLDATPAPLAVAPAVPAPTPREPAAEGGGKMIIVPMTITLGPGDKVSFEGKDTTVTKLKVRLAEIAKATPEQPLEVARDTSVGPILLKRVVDAGKHLKLPTKVLDATPAPEGTPMATKTTPPAEAPKAKPVNEPAKPSGPLNVQVQPNGAIKFKNKTITLAEFQRAVKEAVAANPEQELVIKSGTKVPYEKLKDVLDRCNEAHVRHLTVTSPSPAPPPVAPAKPVYVPESPANNLPAPALLMHPSMDTTSSNSPPMAPSLPSTNAPPPPSGP